MIKNKGLMVGLFAMASIGGQGIFDDSYSGSGLPSIRRKTALNPNQKRLRLKAKRARIARRANRK